MTFCFKCPTCDLRVEMGRREPAPVCHVDMVRDYRAEGVQVSAAALVSRQTPLAEKAAKFLPQPSDFAGPDDPDGMRGLRPWRDVHQPTKGDVIGDMLPKTVF
jgi:hypothetical protein